MKCSVYIATSADGYIANLEGGVDWLHSAGNPNVDMSANPDMGFNQFITSVDCMIMGRRTMEAIANFKLTESQWPYGNIPIYAISKTTMEAPTSLLGKVKIYQDELAELLLMLENKGYQHIYIDGGSLITSCINLKKVNQMTITKAPVLLGQGIPLFGQLNTPIKLTDSKAVSFPNGFIQTTYQVDYS
ncbi:MAG: dihydrofolate reductase family protein [Colwellia sp.]